MRTFATVFAAVILVSCGQLSLVTDNDECRRSFNGDAYCKQEKNLAENKPNSEGEWGLALIQVKSLQLSLARRKMRARGCQRLAKKYHSESVAITKQAPGKFSVSGCQIIASDVYWKQKREAQLWYVDAWVGVPIGDTAQAWLEKAQSTSMH